MTWTLVIDQLGRPHTANAERRLHHHAAAAIRKKWNHTTAILAGAASIPRLTTVHIVAQGRYPGGNLPDADALAPSVKGAIDGLVTAGVIPDDGPRNVLSVLYLAPIVEPGTRPALLLTVKRAS